MFKFKFFACLMAITLSFGAFAYEFKEGKDYFKLEEPVPELNNKIIEFFTYKCSYCYRSERSVDSLKETLPDNVGFERLPVTFGYVQLEPLAYASLLLKEFGLEEELHDHLFQVVKVPLEDEKADFNFLESLDDVKKFFLAHGIDEKNYDQTMEKLKSSGKVHAADKRASAFKVGGTPTFIINGKYKVYGFDSAVGYYKEMAALLIYVSQLKD